MEEERKENTENTECEKKSIFNIIGTIIIALFVTLVFAVAITVIVSNPKETIVSHPTYGYTRLDGNNRLVGYDNMDVLLSDLSKDDDKTRYLFIGYSGCPWCQQYVETYDKYARENNEDLLYYTKLTEIKGFKEYQEEDGTWNIDYKTEDYKKLVMFLENSGALTDNECVGEYITVSKPWIYVPKLFAIKNGEVIKYLSGEVEGHVKVDGKLPEMDDTQQKTLDEIASGFFK